MKLAVFAIVEIVKHVLQFSTIIFPVMAYLYDIVAYLYGENSHISDAAIQSAGP